MAEQPHTDDDAALKREPFLSIHELLLEPGAAAERHYFVVSYHSFLSFFR
jgi:hypothetical protein